MSKVVKLTEEDLKKMVQTIIEDQDWKGSTDPEIMQLGQQGPEELDGSDEYDDDRDDIDATSNDGIPLALAKDEQGNYFVFQDDGSENPKVYHIKQKGLEGQ
jgi:hypothetical protein